MGLRIRVILVIVVCAVFESGADWTYKSSMSSEISHFDLAMKSSMDLRIRLQFVINFCVHWASQFLKNFNMKSS